MGLEVLLRSSGLGKAGQFSRIQVTTESKGKACSKLTSVQNLLHNSAFVTVSGAVLTADVGHLSDLAESSWRQSCTACLEMDENGS